MAITDDTKLLLSTRHNLLKIYASGNTTQNIASNYNVVTFSYDPVTVLLYTHNLGYIPRARVWYEAVSGQIWPLSLDQMDNSDGGPGSILYTVGSAYLTTTGLYVKMTNNSGSAADFKFYYRIYLDE